MRITNEGEVQKYLCRGCARVFSSTVLPYMNTSPNVVLRAMTLYNHGYSFQRASNIMNHVYGEKVPRNTIHHWAHRYKDLFSYMRLRDKNESKRQLAVKHFEGVQMRIHRKKLRLLGQRYPIFHRYAISLLRSRNIKRGPEATSSRWDGKKENLKKAYGSRIEVVSRECRLISMIKENIDLFEVSRMLIINDAFTVATSMPVSFRSNGPGGSQVLFAVADIVQIRDGWFNILTYSREGEDQIEVLKGLLDTAEAFIGKCSVPAERIRVGALDQNRMWAMELPSFGED